MTKCAECGKTGGRMRFCANDGQYRHVGRCVRTRVYHKRSTFPFTTTHLEPNNGPVEVQSLRHLRQLESQHGVVSEVYNNDQSYQGERY